MAVDFIRLNVSPENLERLRRRDPSQWFYRSSSLLRLRDADGAPLPIALGYLRSMAAQGYVGLQQIPRECVVR